MGAGRIPSIRARKPVGFTFILMIPESENVSLLHSLIHLTGSRCPGNLLENSEIRLNNSINIRNVRVGASLHSAANEAN